MRIVLDDADLRRLPITIDPEIVSGAPVFRNTRVPVEALVTNLEDGMSLEEFLDNFPAYTKKVESLYRAREAGGVENFMLLNDQVREHGQNH